MSRHPPTIVQKAPIVPALSALERIYSGDHNISRYLPGIVVKFGLADFEEEVCAMLFIYGRLSVPTPRVLHHPPFLNTFVDPFHCGKDNIWWFTMEERPGVPLNTVIDSMTPTELDHVACQLKGVLQQMRSIKSSTLGSVSGGPYRNRFMPWPYHPTCAFASVGEFLDHIRGFLCDLCCREYVDELLACFPREDTIHFVHGDLLPQNILVEGSTITAIIDWETAGFYPAFWEYCRMHCSQLMTPAWGHVLSHIFPEQDAETVALRMAQSQSVTKIVLLLKHNC